MINRMNAQSLCSFFNKAAYTVFTTPSEKARFQHLGKESTQLQLELSQNRKTSSSCSFFSFFCFGSASGATKQANLQARLTVVRAEQEQISSSSVKRAYVVAGVVGVVALSALALSTGLQFIKSDADPIAPAGLNPGVDDLEPTALPTTEPVVSEEAARPQDVELSRGFPSGLAFKNTSSLEASEVVDPVASNAESSAVPEDADLVGDVESTEQDLALGHLDNQDMDGV